MFYASFFLRRMTVTPIMPIAARTASSAKFMLSPVSGMPGAGVGVAGMGVAGTGKGVIAGGIHTDGAIGKGADRRADKQDEKEKKQLFHG